MDVEIKKKAPGKWELSFQKEPLKIISGSVVTAQERSSILGNTLQEVRSTLSELEYKGGLRLAFKWLATRSLHSKKLEALLKRHFLEDQTIKKIIKRLQELSYINDEAWVSSRSALLQKKGKSLVQAQGVMRHLHAVVPENFDEKESLCTLIKKKYPKLLTSHLSRLEREKLIQRILRRGFSFSLLQEVLNGVYEG